MTEEVSRETLQKIEKLNELGYTKSRLIHEYKELGRAAEIIIKDFRPEVTLTVRSFYEVLRHHSIPRKTKAEIIEDRSRSARKAAFTTLLANLESVGLNKEKLLKLYEDESIKGIIRHCQELGLKKVYKTNIRSALEFYGANIDSNDVSMKKANVRRVNTLLSKHGVDNVAKVPETINRGKETLIRKLLVSEGKELDDLKDANLEELLKLSNGRVFTARTRKPPKFTNAKYSKDELRMKSILFELGISESDFKHNDRKLLHPFEVDFFIPERGLGIEVNPIWTHSHKGGFKSKAKDYHQNKLIEMFHKNLDLISWFTFDSEEMIFEIIAKKLNPQPIVYKDFKDELIVNGNFGRDIEAERNGYKMKSFVFPSKRFSTREGVILLEPTDKTLEVYDCGSIVYALPEELLLAA